MKTILRTFLTGVTLALAGVSTAQDFEGVIMLKETHRSNEIAKRITVKGDKVMVETFGSTDTTDLKGIKIVDLKTGTITALLPSRKLYFNIPNKAANKPFAAEVKSTDDKKSITVKSATATKAYDCKKFVVSSTERKAKVTYWIASGNFTFYSKMLMAINSNEVIADFFGKLAESKSGAMPLKAREERLDGTEIQTIEIVEITAKTVSETVFDIPADYSLMER